MRKERKDYSNIGKLTILIGILILCPLIVLPFYPEDIVHAPNFLIPGLGSILLGILICLFLKKKNTETNALYTGYQGNLMVLYVWGYSFVVGGLPFLISGQLNFVQSVFESVSGWTTTGLSVMDVSQVTPIYLFYRAFMQFCGGLGFVMIMTAFIQGKLNMNLYYAEGHSDKMMPNLQHTVRAVVGVYLSCFAVGTIAYVICGMPIFDSITHTMCALSTGGFSNQVDSLGAYQSIPMEVVTIILMLIGTTNFYVLILAARRQWREVWKVSEVRFLAALLAIFVPILGCGLSVSLYCSLGEGMRLSVFNIVSALSTSGFSTMSYATWPEYAIAAMILLMLIGGGIGSTAGGIKLTRVLIILKASWQNVKKKISADRSYSKQYFYRPQGKTPIDANLLEGTTSFAAIYLILFVIGTIGISITTGANLSQSMFEFSSALGTVGLSIGLTGPQTDSATLLIEICGMVLGRLEIFVVLTGAYSAIALIKRRKVMEEIRCKLRKEDR